MSNPHFEQPSPNIAPIYPQPPQDYNRPPQQQPQFPIPANYQNQPPSYSQLPYPHQHQSYPQQQQQQQQQQPQLYPQPPPSYGAVQPPTTTQPPPTVELSNVVNLRTDSETVQCPHCYQFVTTNLDYNMGLMTGASMVVLYLFGCHSGGCLIPALIPGLKDISHKCPNCKQIIATYERLERQTRVHAPNAGLS